ncbi:putative transcription factor C2H2 family [Helianthus annuus]|nr:putative transcription factor C2H2 family [Helianthus annuus]KAJ0847318.1 putative transcription factor C2H2 family [Helianthus annuus]
MSDSHLVERFGKILMVSIVIFSVAVIFISFIHHYAKWFWRHREAATNTPRRRRRGDFTAGYQEQQQSGVTVLRRGLDPAFLKTIPVIPFDPKEFTQGLECAVCLSDVCEGEKTRILPKCNHGFHVECIDMWFYSHSTCPICRNTVAVVENLLETQEESTDFPTNILFWGDETEVSTLTSQLEEANSSSSSYHQPASGATQMRPDHLVIDIPLSSSRRNDCDGDQKSPSPVSTSRITRILSGSRRFINPFSHAGGGEQGSRGHF